MNGYTILNQSFFQWMPPLVLKLGLSISKCKCNLLPIGHIWYLSLFAHVVIDHLILLYNITKYLCCIKSTAKEKKVETCIELVVKLSLCCVFHVLIRVCLNEDETFKGCEVLLSLDVYPSLSSINFKKKIKKKILSWNHWTNCIQTW